MRYQHTIAYWIKGIKLSEDESAKEIASDTRQSFHAVLTNDISPYCFENDRKEVIQQLILNKAFDQINPDFLEEYLPDCFAKILEFRKKEFSGGPYLILVKEGTLDESLQGNELKLEDFIVYLNEIDEDEIGKYQLEKNIYSKSQQHILNTISAVTLSTPGIVLGLKKVSDSIVFFREDKKPIYSYIFWKTVDAYFCVGIRDQEIQGINSLYKSLSADSSLGRVCKLLVLSLESEVDTFRAFLFAWTALEIFTNKVFKFYEKAFFDELNDDDCPKTRSYLLKSIREVMNNKYSMSLKFSLIASLLCSQDSDQDTLAFKVAKKIRDEILHGEDFDEANLPVHSVQYIVQKYLHLHIAVS